MARTAEEYRELLLALMPSGDIWPREPGTVLAELCLALGEELARADIELERLVEESDPRTAFELLADWERACGLPDTCSALTGTLQERRAAVLAKLTARGGQSRAYFLGLAEALGYEIEITEFRPFAAGVARAGRTVNRGCVRHWWRVAGLETPPIYRMKAGAWTAGNSIAAFGSRDMECVLTQKKPAQSRLLFDYGEE